MHEIIQINENTWRIENGDVRCFVLEGESTALMIDTGMDLHDAAKIAGTITDRPLKLLNTHADPDHTSGNAGFEEFYMHPDEWENYHDMHGNQGRMVPVKDGDVIDLGSRPLMIIDLPGHTPGSIGILDINARVLYSGDVVQDSYLFMFGKRRNLDRYIASLDRLWHDHSNEFDVIYPSHGTFPLGRENITLMLQTGRDIAAGRAAGKEIDFFGNRIMFYPGPCADFLCDIK